MEFYDDEADDDGNDWEGEEWPEGWDYLADENDWEVFDIEISISYSGEGE